MGIISKELLLSALQQRVYNQCGSAEKSNIDPNNDPRFGFPQKKGDSGWLPGKHIFGFPQKEGDSEKCSQAKDNYNKFKNPAVKKLDFEN